MRPGPTAGAAGRWFQLHMGFMRRLYDYCLDGGSMRPGLTVGMGRLCVKLHMGGTMRSCVFCLDGGSMRPGPTVVLLRIRGHVQVVRCLREAIKKLPAVPVP